MIRFFRCSYAFMLLVLTLGSASAQVPTGTPPLGSFGGGPDIIDLANLNAHIDVPVLQKAGRGLNFTYDLSNDTSVWYPVGGSGSQSWQSVYNWGWRSITEAGIGYVAATVTVLRTCKNQSGGITGYEFEATNWTYHDPLASPTPLWGSLFTLTVDAVRLRGDLQLRDRRQRLHDHSKWSSPIYSLQFLRNERQRPL